MGTREILAANIRLLIAADSLSQDQLAKKSGLGQRTISNLIRPETGHMPRIDVIERLADALRVEAWRLLLPDMTVELLRGNGLAEVVHSYVEADERGRGSLESVSALALQSSHQKNEDPTKATN